MVLICRALLLLTGVCGLIGVVSLMILNSHHQRLLSVQTASMVPTFRSGDVLVIGPVPVSRLQPGDVISYHDPRSGNAIISHRLVNIDKQSGWLTTAGDASRSHDPAFPPQQMVGQVWAVAPGLGCLLNGLRHPLALALLTYVPAIIVIVAELKHLARSYARPFYSVRLEA